MLKTRLTQYQWLAILMLGWLTSACRPEPPVILLPTPHPLAIPPHVTDPPIPLPEAFIGENTRLVEEVWQLVAFTLDGKEIEFEAITPVILTFHRYGFLGLSSCKSSSRKIIVEPDASHYRLYPSASNAMGCSSPLRDHQASGVSQAIDKTNRYEILGEQLLLLGEGVQLIFEPDPTNIFRGERAGLIRNTWHLVALTHQGMRIPFDAIFPIRVSFNRPNNALQVSTTGCTSVSHNIVLEGEQSYKLISTYPISEFPDCGEPENTQVAAVAKAILASTRYQLAEDRLWLLGEEVEIVLANEPVPYSFPASTSPIATPTPP